MGVKVSGWGGCDDENESVESRDCNMTTDAPPPPPACGGNLDGIKLGTHVYYMKPPGPGHSRMIPTRCLSAWKLSDSIEFPVAVRIVQTSNRLEYLHM